MDDGRTTATAAILPTVPDAVFYVEGTFNDFNNVKWQQHIIFQNH